jgi:hypothetical protein
MAKLQRRDLSVKFTLTCSQGNTCVEGVPLGAVGDWVGRMGGDDLAVEALIYFGEHTMDTGLKFTLVREKGGSDVKN